MAALERVEWTDPELQQLIAAQRDEVNARYESEAVPEVAGEHVVGGVLARIDGTAVSCGLLAFPVETFGETTAEIMRMFVLPEHRRKGLAKDILRELEALAQERGYNQTVLQTGILQPEAIGLYSSEGYRVIDNYPPYEDLEDSRCFAKPLGE